MVWVSCLQDPLRRNGWRRYHPDETPEEYQGPNIRSIIERIRGNHGKIDLMSFLKSKFVKPNYQQVGQPLRCIHHINFDIGDTEALNHLPGKDLLSLTSLSIPTAISIGLSRKRENCL
jgi:hypothetical protein